MAQYQYANDPSTTLSGSLTAIATSLSVTSAADFPALGKFTIIVDSEIMLVTGVVGSTWTVARGVEDTTAAAHNNNATVTGIVTKGSFLDAHWFDVRNYGATGDGSTDDEDAINLATAACTTAGGGTVYLPPGNYVIGSTITIGSNTLLRGAGLSSKITNATADLPAIQADTKSNVSVRDLWIVGGNNGARTLNYGVQFFTVTEGLISGVRAQQCYQGIILSASSSVTVENNYIADDVGAGSSAGIRITDCDRCTIRGNFVDTPAAHGINAGNNGTDTLIEGNHIWSVGNIGIAVAGGSTPGMTGPGLTVMGNHIRDSAVNGIHIENGATYVRCIGNFVYESVADGISSSGGTGDVPSNIVIANNVVRDSGRYGIFDNGTQYITIEGNHVTVYVDDGIRCGGGLGAKVVGNTVLDGSATTGRAIVIYAALTDAVVANNIVKNNAGRGIQIDAARAVVTGNSVVDSDNTGVLTIGGIQLTAEADRTVVIGNSSTRGTGTKQDYGIVIDSGCLNAMVVGNNFVSNTTAPTADNGTGTVLANNIIT